MMLTLALGRAIGIPVNRHVHQTARNHHTLAVTAMLKFLAPGVLGIRRRIRWFCQILFEEADDEVSEATVFENADTFDSGVKAFRNFYVQAARLLVLAHGVPSE
jgi:hypothetical protein